MRSSYVLGLLALAGCSADVFVGPDAGSASDAATDAGQAEGGVIEGGTTSRHVQCGDTLVCSDQVCCGTVDWTASTCTAGSATCQDYLECDDSADCPSSQVCCGLQGSNAAGTEQKITHSSCAFGCGLPNSVQLCTTSTECGGGSCQDYKGLPTWLKTCQ